MKPPISPPTKKESLLKSVDSPPQTPAVAHQPTDLPILAMIPDVTHEELRAAGLAPLRHESRSVRRVFPKEVLFVHQPRVITAAYRNLTAKLLETRPSGSLRSLLLTSTSAGEGKTLTAVNTAITLAKMGARVLLIDANLHRPACHTMLAMPHGLGFGEFLSGKRELSELLQPTSIDRLVFLAAGSSVTAPAEILNSTSLPATLPFLYKMYDYLVIDSPPVDSAADALLLATRVDGVVLIVDTQRTPSPQRQNTEQRLTQMNISLLGVVMNKADARRR